MTKKHFEWAAEQLRREAYLARERGEPTAGFEWSAKVVFLSDMFKHFNPRFDVARFREACKPNP